MLHYVILGGVNILDLTPVFIYVQYIKMLINMNMKSLVISRCHLMQIISDLMAIIYDKFVICISFKRHCMKNPGRYNRNLKNKTIQFIKRLNTLNIKTQ